MKIATPSHAEHELTQLAAYFAHWRQHRTSRAEPIPHSLWEPAVACATVLPRSRVARQFRLSGQALQQRGVAPPLAASAPPTRATAAEASRTALNCVEVPAPAPWPLPTSGTEIERQRIDGARLRIRSHEPQPPIAALGRTFLETR
jgi:hypothetical protein